MISTRCCSPTDSCQIFASGSTGMCNASAICSTTLVRSCGAKERLRPSSEDDVLGDGQRVDETKVLMHHPDPGSDGIARSVKLDGLPTDLDPALVRVVEAREDVHQRRLPCSVLTEQSVDLPFGDLERDVVVGHHSGEALRDPAHRYGHPWAGGRSDV